MKVFKNKKQRFVAVFLSLVFAFMLVPFTDVYAESEPKMLVGNDTYFDCDVEGHDDVYVKGISSTSSEHPLYKFYFKINGSDHITYGVSYFCKSGYLDTSNVDCTTGTSNESDDGRYSMFRTFSSYPVNNAPWYFDVTNGYGGYDSSRYLGDALHAFIRDFMSGKSVNYNQYIEITGNSEGGINNPIYDEDIGTLIISKSKMYEESNGEDVNDLYNLFSWKMKTNTGFSLSDNKYARTFIQVRVESKCVVYDDRRHTKLHKKFDNYGEKAMLINSHPVDSQPLKISYLTDIPNVLPKTHAETHNPVYAGYNYTLYFRVVCTDDLAVIPSDTSDWHCGGWRALDCNADILVGQSDTTENGDFDDSDNWVPDEDDGNNHIESGSDSVHDSDDAKDDFNNSSSAVDSSVNGAISTLQSLLDMIRHVPEIISIIFSFLPNWCLSIVGLAFVALVVLIIYKLVRG